MPSRDLPAGTVTLLFTDVEGSTRLLGELGEKRYAEALNAHRRLLREAIAEQAGIEVDTQGDAIFAAFPTAVGALAAAQHSQEALTSGPIRVRMGIHTGTPLRTAEGYVGVDVHRAARIAAAGHGGQVLMSSATRNLLEDYGASTLDLGEHRLKDLAGAERLFQLGDQPFPPLRSLSPSTLPEPAGTFVGRDAELTEVGELLRDPAVRLLTLVGLGGIGKTRLALRAAAKAAVSFPDGRWWVPLAPIGEVEEAVRAIGQELGLGGEATPDAIASHLASRRALVLIDNSEHLLPDLAEALATIVRQTGGSTLLVTSREPLNVAAERLVRVPVMTQTDAEDLLLSRAVGLGVAVAPSGALSTLAERLDRLPLALTLAASRLSVLSADQILERLSQRLDLFAGARDADPRQRTLRATIEWSHDLLTDAELVLFRRLSVFAGGCTFEAAEAVCDADLDALQGLVDRSLVERLDVGDGPPRFAMLDTIRQFAAEQLAASGEEAMLLARHADWIRDLAERVDQRLLAGEPEEQWVRLLEPEVDNLRAAVGYGLRAGDAALVRAIAVALPMFWVMRGRVAEGRAWIERALELDASEDDTRRRLLSGLGMLAYMAGDYAAATGAADDAAALATQLGPSIGRTAQLRTQIAAAMAHEDYATAEPLYEELLEVARAEGNGVRTSACRINLAYIANRTGRHERAEALMLENLPFVRSRGQARCEANTLVTLAETNTYLDRPATSATYAVAAAEVAPRAADAALLVEDLRWYARAACRLGEAEAAATILGACETAEAELEAALEPHELTVRAELEAALRDSLTDAGLEAARANGRSLDLAAAAALMQVPSAVQSPA